MTADPVVAEILGRFASASNATLLGRCDGELVVYKPAAGTRELWDFDAATLADREVLAHDLAEALGFTGLVPPHRPRHRSARRRRGAAVRATRPGLRPDCADPPQ